MGFGSQIKSFIHAKRSNHKWAMLTAYDAPTAGVLEAAGVDWILVGDSLGMVVLGYDSTTAVTMAEMIHHAKAVRRGAPKSFVIGDLPLKGVEKGPRHALESARRFVKEAGCDAVKLEWNPSALETVRLFVRNKIPAMGHLGLTPQALRRKKDFRVQGTSAESAFEILERARLLQDSGVFSILLECVPSAVAKIVTQSLKIPVIGIGAGPDCDGQVLVFHDVVGLFKKFTPRFVKRYADLEPLMRQAAARYVHDVKAGKFPQKKHGFGIKKEELLCLLKRWE
jgi:3-methyl-2-oxobutanoate hydroxymethyltransferase